MANDITYNGTKPTSIVYNGTNVNVVKYNNTYVWGRPFTYTTGSKTGVASITCTRASSPYAHASTGTVATGGTIYYGDTIYFTATATTGYNAPTSSKTSSSPLTVTGNVTGADYITAGSVITYTLTLSSSGTSALSYFVRVSSPLGGGSTGSLSNGATLYYGDTYYAQAGVNSGGYYSYKATTWSLTAGGTAKTATTTFYQRRNSTYGYTASSGINNGCGAYKEWGSASSPWTVTGNIVVSGGTTVKSWTQVWSGSVSWGGIRDKDSTRTSYFNSVESTNELFIPSHVRLRENVKLQSTLSSEKSTLVNTAVDWSITHAGINGQATTSYASSGDIHGRTLRVNKKPELYYFYYYCYKIEVYK